MASASTMSVQCRCCLYFTLSAKGSFEICPICFWEDDGLDQQASSGGPNGISLKEARQNFSRCSAMSESVKQYTRLPTQEEIEAQMKHDREARSAAAERRIELELKNAVKTGTTSDTGAKRGTEQQSKFEIDRN